MGPMYTMRQWKRREEVREDDSWHWAREYDVAHWVGATNGAQWVASELARIAGETYDTESGGGVA